MEGSTKTLLDAFTQPWAEAYGVALQANVAYRKAAHKWEGSVGLILRANPVKGVMEDRGVLLDLLHGDCRSATAVAASRVYEAADFVIEGDYGIWRDVLDGKADPFKSIMFGRLRLKKGSLAALLPYTTASKELVKSAQAVPTNL